MRRVRKIKLQIKSTLLYHGIHIPNKYDTPHWSKAFLKWLKNIEWYYPTIAFSFESMLEELMFHDKALKDVSTKIRTHCRRHHKQDYDLLRSVPGIGPLSAAYILSEIGDIRRFTAFKKFASYVGIVPNVHNSGDITRAIGVNPRANRTIRTTIVEASWVAIRHDPVLQEYFRKHAHHNSKAAIFKVSRKLLSRIYAVIHSSTPYEVGLIQ
ncbi:MAG: IS110 family transposase [Saprospiraceae bacterium]|nr:IS110 family transposase [Saprospiraceae bacterium]